MRIRLIALDIDDTIYHWPGEVSPGNREAIRAAGEAGIPVCIATARHVASADDFTTKAGIAGPLVANSGATIRMKPGGDLITRAPMTREGCLPIIEWADANEVVLWITLADSTTYVRDDSPQSPEALARHIFPVATNVEGLVGDPVRLIASGDGGARLYEALSPQLNGRFNLHRTFRGGEFVGLAITSHEATKEAGLADVCARLGIGMDEVLAMGDAEADMGMIRAAGIGVAPANAEDSVKAAADIIAPACSEDAVAWAIRRFCDI
jgi:Cof subfamily protein (haloacid dehalogenase superfamily)